MAYFTVLQGSEASAEKIRDLLISGGHEFVETVPHHEGKCAKCGTVVLTNTFGSTFQYPVCRIEIALDQMK